MVHVPSSNVFQTHELRSLRFFLDKTTVQISSPFSQGLWSKTVPSIAQHESSIKYALMALSEFHEKYMSSTNSPPELGRLALKHYNVAIRGLLNTEKQKVSPVIGLLCCLLFFAAELLQGKLASAVQLFGTGRRIIHELRRSALQAVQPEPYHELFQVLREAFMRLEYHVSAYFTNLSSDLSFNDCYGPGNTIDASSESTGENYLPTTVAVFNSLPQALEGLRRFAHDAVNKAFSHISNPQSDKQRLANWCTAFESFKQTMPNPYTTENKSIILSLELWWRQLAMHILAVSAAPHSSHPMWWDQHQAQLEELLDYIEKIIHLYCEKHGDGGHDEKPSPPTFCLETGLVTHLVTVMGRCRDPYVRRRALALLKMYNRQEGFLQRELTIESCQQMIDLEERGLEVKCAADIPAEARVVGSSMELHPEAPELKIKYLIGGEWITEVITWSSADN